MQVLSKGGSEMVCRSQGWEEVAVQMHLAPSAEEPNPGRELEQIYCDYLLRFEQNAGPENRAALLQLSVMVSFLNRGYSLPLDFRVFSLIARVFSQSMIEPDKVAWRCKQDDKCDCYYLGRSLHHGSLKQHNPSMRDA